MKYIYISLLTFIAGVIPIDAQQQITINGNMKLHNGASMSVLGDFKNNGTFVDSGDVVNFNGSSNQLISGTTVSQFRNVVINNSAGATLNQSIIVSNSLQLLNGPLVLNTHVANIQNGLVTAITRNNGYIVSEQTDNSSRVNWSIGAQPGPHIYPFGVLGGEYIPFTLDLMGGNMGDVSIATYHTSFNNTPYPVSPDLVTHLNNSLGADNSANVVDRFWQIDKNGASGTASMTFVAQISEVGSITNLNAQRWNSITQGWDVPLPGQSSTGNSVTVNNVTNFSPWILSGNNSPLPIELLSFTATPNNYRQVDLNWTTSAEVNNDYFTIERTQDGVNFEIVGKVKGAGNSDQLLHYYLLDAFPFEGTSYYRLKQTDFNNSSKYSPLESVFFGESNVLAVNVYPNPSHGSFTLSISGANDEDVSIGITDIMGRIYYYRVLHINQNLFTLTIDESIALASGLYNLEIMGVSEHVVTKLVIE